MNRRRETRASHQHEIESVRAQRRFLIGMIVFWTIPLILFFLVAFLKDISTFLKSQDGTISLNLHALCLKIDGNDVCDGSTSAGITALVGYEEILQIQQSWEFLRIAAIIFLFAHCVCGVTYMLYLKKPSHVNPQSAAGWRRRCTNGIRRGALWFRAIYIVTLTIGVNIALFMALVLGAAPFNPTARTIGNTIFHRPMPLTILLWISTTCVLLAILCALFHAYYRFNSTRTRQSRHQSPASSNSSGPRHPVGSAGVSEPSPSQSIHSDQGPGQPSGSQLSLGRSSQPEALPVSSEVVPSVEPVRPPLEASQAVTSYSTVPPVPTVPEDEVPSGIRRPISKATGYAGKRRLHRKSNRGIDDADQEGSDEDEDEVTVAPDGGTTSRKPKTHVGDIDYQTGFAPGPGIPEEPDQGPFDSTFASGSDMPFGFGSFEAPLEGYSTELEIDLDLAEGTTGDTNDPSV